MSLVSAGLPIHFILKQVSKKDQVNHCMDEPFLLLLTTKVASSGSSGLVVLSQIR